MDQLQALLGKLCGLDSQELRQIRFRYPQKGLLQAIRQLKGDETADKLLESVASEFSIDFIPGEKIEISADLISNAANEISRLAFALKAAPIKIIPTAQGECLLLAMSNPSDEHTREVFARLFSKPVKPALVREDELLEAIRFNIPSGKRGTRVLRSTDAPDDEPSHVTDGLKELLVKVIDSNARGLQFNILGANTLVNLVQTGDRLTALDCNISADELLSAILHRARINNREAAGFSGVAHFSMLPTGIDFSFEYQPEFKADTGEKGRQLNITKVSVKNEIEDVFWTSPAKKASQALSETLANHPGLYIIAMPDLEQQDSILPALQRLYPDLHLLKEIKELSTDPDTATRLKYSRVVLPIKAKGINQVVQLLEKAPPALKGLVRGIVSFAELARPCTLCLEELATSPETLQLVPESLHSRLQRLKYPRGCPVCSNGGYIGSTTVLSFASTESTFGESLRAGASAKDLTPLLRKEGWTPIAEIALEQTLSANAVLEQVAETFLGKSPKTSKPLASQFNSEMTVLDKSRIWRSDANPDKQVDFHSVVLEAGGDLLAAREALLAEEAGGGVSPAANFLGTHEASTPKDPQAAKSNNDSGHDFHSVVLDLDDDMASMRAKLLAEMDED